MALADNGESFPAGRIAALIDADSMVYSAGFVTSKVKYGVRDKEFTTPTQAVRYCEEHSINPEEIEHLYSNIQPLAHATQILDNGIKAILKKLDSAEYEVVLSGKENFRYAIYPEYKANRRYMAKPYHFKAMREYLVDNWWAVVTEHGLEADDYVAMYQTEETCIVSQDKDLDTVAGWHYNYKKPDNGPYFLTEQEALWNFYFQMLCGDTADNIPGLPRCTPELVEKYHLSRQALKGCGPATAKKLLFDCTTEEQLFERALECFHGLREDEEKALAEILLNGRLLHMTRSFINKQQQQQPMVPVLWELPEQED